MGGGGGGGRGGWEEVPGPGPGAAAVGWAGVVAIVDGAVAAKVGSVGWKLSTNDLCENGWK